MTTIYGSIIEICLDPVFYEISNRYDAIRDELRPIRDKYYKELKNSRDDKTASGRTLLDLFLNNASHDHKLAAEIGYVGSYHNCAFELLYALFGIDVVAFLFNRDWIPNAVIDPFRPDLYLERVSVLDKLTDGLTDGARIPVFTRQTLPYARKGMAPTMKYFSERKHRILAELSLGELRSFGQLALSHRRTHKKLSVDVHIYSVHGHHEPVVLQFATKQKYRSY